MTGFTDAERVFIHQARLARMATASPPGEPDAAVVWFALNGDVNFGG